MVPGSRGILSSYVRLTLWILLDLSSFQVVTSDTISPVPAIPKCHPPGAGASTPVPQMGRRYRRMRATARARHPRQPPSSFPGQTPTSSGAAPSRRRTPLCHSMRWSIGDGEYKSGGRPPGTRFRGSGYFLANQMIQIKGQFLSGFRGESEPPSRSHHAL